MTSPAKLKSAPTASGVSRSPASTFGVWLLKFGRPTGTLVDLDPSAASEIAEQIAGYEPKIERRLFPIGFFEHQDRIYLLVDEKELAYTLVDERDLPDPSAHEHLIWSELEPLAWSFELALGHILRGRVMKSQIEADLKAVEILKKIWQLEAEEDYLSDQRTTRIIKDDMDRRRPTLS